MTGNSFEMKPLLFGWLDFSVFGFMLAISALIGIYFGFFGKQDSKTEYLFGGKTMKTVPVAISLVAGHISGITLMGVPSEIYIFGSLYGLMCISIIFVILILNYVYIPIFFELQVTSTYEYLELRFSRAVRVMSSVLYTIDAVIFMPIVLYVPALAFSQVSGVSVHWITSLVCVTCVFYTMLGGLKAVVWTEFVQSFLMVGACITIVCLGVHNVGGWATVFQRSNDGGRIFIFDMDPSPTARNSFWTVLIGTTLVWTCVTTGQGCIQKFLSLPTLRNAKQALVLFGIGIIFMTFISVVTGLIIYANYYDCDPIQTQTVNRPDQLLAYFVMDIAGSIPGLPGLFISGVFCAALSSLSGILNGLTATIFEDFIYPFLINKEDERLVSYIMKGTVLVLGLQCVLLVFVVEKLGGVLELCYSMAGITMGALLGLFSLGMFCPWANAKGAFWGSITSLALVSFIAFGAQNAIATGRLTHKTLPTSVEGCSLNITSASTVSDALAEEKEEVFFLFRLSYWYYSVVGTFTVIIVGMIVSAITGLQDPRNMNPALFAPFLRRFTHPRTNIRVQITDPAEMQPLETFTNEHRATEILEDVKN